MHHSSSLPFELQTLTRSSELINNGCLPNSCSHCLQIHSHLYSPSRIFFLIKDWYFIIHLCVYGYPSSLLRLVVKARSETNCWTHLPHLEGGEWVWGSFSQNFPLTQKLLSKNSKFSHYSLFSLIISYMWIHISNIYQQYIINKSSPQGTQDVCTIFLFTMHNNP